MTGVVRELGSSPYNRADRLLHRLALGSRLISETTYDLDSLLSRNNGPFGDERHLFICGLARSGTTALMRTFHETGSFRSLTYRDMPFVLAPVLWNKLSTPFFRNDSRRERAQGDRILIDFESPEALEEVFWRTFSGRSYLFADCLKPYLADERLIKEFRGYVRRIVTSSANPDRMRYLSKNNNNILRLESIRKAFPNGLILIPFRNPFHQAQSLFKQHLKFTELESEDPFIADYMRWLGHHEYGLTHLPFRFGDQLSNRANPHGPDDPNYWLALWIECYHALLERAPAEAIFICYEDLCDSPLKSLQAVFDYLNLTIDEVRLKRSLSASECREARGWDEKLTEAAKEVYSRLRRRSLS